MIDRRNFFLLGAAVFLATEGHAQALDREARIEATERRIVRLRFDAPPAEILQQLLTRVDLYDPTIAEVRFDHTNSVLSGKMGRGSVRICVFDDGRELHEPLLIYSPPNAYAYTVDQAASTMALPVSDIALTYEFSSNETGGTDLTVRAFFDPKIPGTAPVITPVLTGTLRRTFLTAVDVFGGEYLGDETP